MTPLGGATLSPGDRVVSVVLEDVDLVAATWAPTG